MNKIGSNQIVHNQTIAMGVLDILRKSLLIASKNINFIIFTVITSLPLFFFLVYYDFLLQKFLLDTNEILQENPGYFQFNKLMRYLLHELTQLGFYYLAPLHLLELCPVLVIVDLASKIYRGDGVPLTLKDMCCVEYERSDFDFGGISGTEALALSSYYSRGSGRCGFILMFLFFVLEMGLRLPCLYIGCYQRGSGVVAQSSFFCLGTALKWVVCVVYFRSCKERTLEKKVDVEEGTEIRVVVDK
ncbi:hypothetical protein FNV43_RR26472 [Rhamnella rubrinervis]|uniref:Transmembrane protein n=1 Tax=Rhamnella rubrinervis TaxID=2594499 RepID=A0A8K0DJS0_9ROSA|nr:hypothetical protein FNV43_RR26472 [Rhamnella rubrinervis]